MNNKFVYIKDEVGIVGVIEEEVSHTAIYKVRVLAIEEEFEGIYGTVIEVSKAKCMLLENKIFSFGEILYWHTKLIKNRLISCVSGLDRTSYPVAKLPLKELVGEWKFKVFSNTTIKFDDCDFELEDDCVECEFGVDEENDNVNEFLDGLGLLDCDEN